MHEFRKFLSLVENGLPSVLDKVYKLIIQGELGSSRGWYPRDDDCRRLARALVNMANLKALYLDVPGFDHPAIITTLCAHERSGLEIFRIVLGKPMTGCPVDISAVSLYPTPPAATVDRSQLRLREGKLRQVFFVPSYQRGAEEEEDIVIYPQAYVHADAQFLGASAKTLVMLNLRAWCSKQFIACSAYQLYPPPHLTKLMAHVDQIVQQPCLEVQSDVHTLELWWHGSGFLENSDRLTFLGGRFPSLKYLAIRARDKRHSTVSFCNSRTIPSTNVSNVL